MWIKSCFYERRNDSVSKPGPDERRDKNTEIQPYLIHLRSKIEGGPFFWFLEKDG